MKKVFGVGMFKTGTKSLGEALMMLGYNTAWWNWGIIKCDWYPTPEDIAPHVDDICGRAQHFDAFCDAPWLYAYKELDKAFPGSKFILTTRNYDDVAQSDINMWVRDGAEPSSIPSRDKFVERIQKHEEEVKTYFKGREDDLLIINICEGEGWEKICPFLEADLPMSPFPHRNKGAYKNEKTH